VIQYTGGFTSLFSILKKNSKNPKLYSGEIGLLVRQKKLNLSPLGRQTDIILHIYTEECSTHY